MEEKKRAGVFCIATARQLPQLACHKPLKQKEHLYLFADVYHILLIA